MIVLGGTVWGARFKPKSALFKANALSYSTLLSLQSSGSLFLRLYLGLELMVLWALPSRAGDQGVLEIKSGACKVCAPALEHLGKVHSVVPTNLLNPFRYEMLLTSPSILDTLWSLEAATHNQT